jgi:cell division protein FtsW
MKHRPSEPGKTKHFYDYSLVFIIIILIVFGLMMIYSASSYRAQDKFGDPMYFLKRQAVIALAGFVCMVLISMVDYHTWLKFSLPAYAISLVLMILVFVIGKEYNGQKRWISFGPVSFQPTELVKIALIMYLAVYITNMGDEIDTWKGLITVVAIDFPAAVLVGLNNLSSGIIILGIAFVISFIATRKQAIYYAILAAGLVLLNFVEPIANLLNRIGLLKDYQLSRIMVWLDPGAHPLDGGYQVLQGLYAIGSGGLTGRGLGESIQKLGFVPEAQNDMIFSIICEELGLFGAVSVILMFLFLLWRCLVIANSAPDLYGTLLTAGVMTHIAIQLILNICVVSNVIPNTGITLPFISYGGTSVLLLLCEMGLVLSVSRSIKIG